MTALLHEDGRFGAESWACDRMISRMGWGDADATADGVLTSVGAYSIEVIPCRKISNNIRIGRFSRAGSVSRA